MKKYLVICLLLFSLFASSQTRLSGTLIDQQRKAVTGATIALINKEKDLILCFTVSDKDGYFSFDTEICNCNPNTDRLILKIQSLGYKTTLISTRIASHLKIILEPDQVRELPDVTVKKSIKPIIIKPDTLKVPVNDLSDQGDKTIGDVIKKIPGIDIDNEGRIKYNGKQLHALYIDGVDILGNKYNIATNNISKLLVNEVQVIENHQPIKLLETLTGGDKVAINLKLSDSVKGKPISNLQFSLGKERSVIGKTEYALVHFSKGIKSINTVKANNSGNEVSIDLNNNGNSESLVDLEIGSRNRILNFNVPSNNNIGESRFLFNEGGVFTSNNVLSSGVQQYKFGGYFLYDNRHQSNNSIVEFSYPNQLFRVDQKIDVYNKIKTFGHYFTFFRNDTKSYWNNITKFDYSGSVQTALNLLNNVSSNQTLNYKSLTIYNDNHFIASLPSSWIFEWKSLIVINNRPEGLFINPGPSGINFNSNQPYSELNQSFALKTFFFKNLFSWKKIKAGFHTTYKFSIIANDDIINASLSYLFHNLPITKLDSGFSNNYHWTQKRVLSSIEFDFLKPSSTFSLILPISGISTDYQNLDLANSSRNSFRHLFFNPLVNCRFRIGKNHELLLTYTFNNILGSSSDIIHGKILNNNNLISRNSIPLKESATHLVQASYSFRNIQSLLFFNSNLEIYQSKNNSITDYTLFPSLRLANEILQNNPIFSLRFSNMVSKYIFPIRSTFTLKYTSSFLSSYISLNHVSRLSRSVGHLVSINARTKVSKLIEFQYDGTLAVSRNNLDNDFISTIKSLRNNFSIKVFPNSLFYINVKGDYSQFYQNGINSQANFFLDGEITYQRNKSRVRASVELLNILNTKNFQLLNLNINERVQNIMPLRQRTILFKVAFGF